MKKEGAYVDDLGFCVLPEGDFYDPDGYYFDKEGYDEFDGYYDDDNYYVPGKKFYEEYFRNYGHFHDEVFWQDEGEVEIPEVNEEDVRA